MMFFTGAWLSNLAATRSFLQEQLISHAQDTATSLGISLSQFMSRDDYPAAETMINAVFDRGYYEIVRLEDINGVILLERKGEITISGVPDWFIKRVKLETPAAEALVMAGWKQSGLVSIKSHPGYAYKALWEIVVRLSLWFFLIALSVILAGGYGLRLLLRPLHRVELQADALCRREYEIQQDIPRTRELKRVVEAMNRMTTTMRSMFAEQSARAESLQREVYRDHLTDLGNRRYFEGQLAAFLAPTDTKQTGALFICQLRNLQELNTARGFDAGDTLLTHAARILEETTQPIPDRVLARLTGGDFAILLPHITPEAAQEAAVDMARHLSGLFSRQLTMTDNVAHIGGVIFTEADSAATLLSAADNALRHAQQQGANRHHVRQASPAADRLPLGGQEWQKILREALLAEQITLALQPVVTSTDRSVILHQEVFSRISLPNGEILNAGIFIPEAERADMISRLDRLVITKVLRLDRGRLNTENVAVNLSASSLRDADFLPWLTKTLASSSPQAPTIIFEFVEFSAVHHLDAIREFARQIKKMGHDIGLDHFGRNFSNFGYLQSLRPAHVKIDAAFTGELTAEANDSRFFLGALCSAAHSLDIRVIAEGVENEKQWQGVKELNINAAQGYWIGKPVPLVEEKE